jgi:hypothetical protein
MTERHIPNSERNDLTIYLHGFMHELYMASLDFELTKFLLLVKACSRSFYLES